MADDTARQLALFGPAPAPASSAGVVPLAAPGPATPLGLAATAFDQHLGRLGKTANTRRAFASDLRLLSRWLGPAATVGALTVDDLRRFLTWLQEGRAQACSAKSYARRVTTLKVFFAWLVEYGARPDDPAAGLVHRRAEPPLPLVLTDADVGALLAAAEHQPDDPRPAVLVRLLLDTALKKGEVMALRVADLAVDAEPPSLLVRYDDPRWREKERRVTFGPDLGPRLAAYRGRYRPTDRLFPCTARNLEYVLADLVTLAGLPERTSFETLRWTSALRAWRAGLDPDAQRARLGLSPITWADTARKLALLADGVGAAPTASPWFPDPGT